MDQSAIGPLPLDRHRQRGDRQLLAKDAIRKRLDFLAAHLQGDYLFGSAFSVADAYLYVMLRWARMQGLDLPEPLSRPSSSG